MEKPLKSLLESVTPFKKDIYTYFSAVCKGMSVLSPLTLKTISSETLRGWEGETRRLLEWNYLFYIGFAAV